jgi:hypothetical protein
LMMPFGRFLRPWRRRRRPRRRCVRLHRTILQHVTCP